MSRTVVFLGAGASKALDLPLTNEIFPQLIERLMPEQPSSPPLFRDDQEARECLWRCLVAFLPGLSEVIHGSQVRGEWEKLLPPITDVLSTLDHALLSGNSPGADLTSLEIAAARTLLERAVFELLVRNENPDALRMKGVPEAVRREWRQTAEREILPTRSADLGVNVRQQTVDWLMDLAATDPDHVTLVSTNYDIEVEQEIYNRLGYEEVFRRVDFGTAVRDPVSGTVHPRPANARYGIYKLHGSLNVLRCSVCDNIYVNPVGAIAYLSFLLGTGTRSPENTDRWFAELWNSGANECHCGHRPLRHVIVAPSYVRDVRDPVILAIWRSALEALRQADEWVIVGYSLPPEDVAIRSMLLRAYQGRDGESRPRVTIVQKRRQEPELTRYRLLLPVHNYFPTDEGGQGGLEGYLNARTAARGG